ncbi:alpha-hydroxy-acid oxidizing protein [Kribbella qitaiheensis]|uniref:Alpha-hydroxy-acid oxidizing protein n=1 Tax=Kribbella qitaiheensis TaxID=1544730 RepID=A0A7G6WYA0_9ACTN|nr:alpha-hydroxy acid oxidase [Kribbella qitaiheensis]QNE18965.1 alpha-hydroxy-acid oxidizing protein [Kribbella qitaiheensis]
MASSLDDYESLASKVLPAGVRDFIAGGSGSETTLRRNRSALDAVTMAPRVLAGVSSPDPSTKLLGTPAAIPVAIAPMAYQQLVHPEGEIALARAAAMAGIPYVISTLSSQPMEQIAAEASTWFQLYWLRDRAMVESLIDRAGQAGCTALMVTVDVPVMGRRLRDVRNAFQLPSEVVAANLVGARTEAHVGVAGASAVATHTAAAFEPSLSWLDLEWIRQRTELPLVVKGILDPRDAYRATETGAEGIVVSNHGGRQLDGAPASIDALAAVVEAVDCEVLLDSGIRSGTDVLRALALGASGVLIGRPLLWALALDAAAEALELLSGELTQAMMLAGCATVAEIADLTTGRA